MNSRFVTVLSDLSGRKINPLSGKNMPCVIQEIYRLVFEKVVKLLIETDYQIKTGQFDKDYLFDIALLRIATS